MTASTSSSSASSVMPSACGAGWRSTAASGRITAFVADQDLDGGGLANLSAAVAFVGATASIGMYDVPKVDVTTVARHSRAVTAGSMRGFGALQTMTALEVMIDEAAASLGRDPVAFRKANLLETGGKTMVGNVVSGALRSGEVLDRLASKPVWSRTRGRKSPPCRCASEQSLWRRPRLRQHGVRQRLRSGLRLGRDRSRRPDHASPRRPSRSAPASRPRSRCAWPTSSGPPPTRCKLGVLDGWDVLGLVDAGRSVHHHPRAAGCGGEESALGSRRRPGHHRIDLGPHPHRGRGRGGERHPALRHLAGGAGDLVGGQVRRPGSRRVPPVRGHPLCRWPLDRRRDGAACASPPRRQGARDGARHRGDGARLQSLVLGTCHLRSSRRALRGRDRCAWRSSTAAARRQRARR